MKRAIIILFIGLVMVVGSAFAQRVDSTRKKLRVLTSSDTTESIIDTVKVTNTAVFNADVVSLRGFSKRAGESKESFLLINHSNMHLSRVVLLFRYFDTNNVLFHEREVIVECDLPPYSSRVTSIKTFDEGHNYYYYNTKNLKEGAVAFKVGFTLLRYDIVVTSS